MNLTRGGAILVVIVALKEFQHGTGTKTSGRFTALCSLLSMFPHVCVGLAFADDVVI